MSVRGIAAGTDGVKVTTGVGGTDDEALTLQRQPSTLTLLLNVSRPRRDHEMRRLKLVTSERLLAGRPGKRICTNVRAGAAGACPLRRRARTGCKPKPSSGRVGRSRGVNTRGHWTMRTSRSVYEVAHDTRET